MDLQNAHIARQFDLIPVSVLGEKITVIGAGAIGSFTVLALAKMGFGDITVFDFDKIEIENMSSQFYRFKDIGKNKAVALRELVKDFTNTEIEIIQDRYNGSRAFPGIVISAVDSMEVRKLIWEAHKERAPSTKAIVDPRMGAEVAACYVMSPMDKKDIESYEKTLYTDENAEQAPCTAKSTVYCALSLSGLVCTQIKGLLVKGVYGRVSTWDICSNQLLSWKNK